MSLNVDMEVKQGGLYIVKLNGKLDSPRLRQKREAGNRRLKRAKKETAKGSSRRLRRDKSGPKGIFGQSSSVVMIPGVDSKRLSPAERQR